MENFVAYNPVKLFFGNNVTDKLGENSLNYGKKALLVYGKGSVVKNGIYNRIVQQLKSVGIDFIEYNGIKSNPIVEDVDEVTQLAIREKVEFIIALGGGSVIDSSKIMAISIANDFKAWEIMKRKVKPKKALPLIAILTLAATGTEMNMFAVLQNNETKEKIGYGHPLVYPKESYLDPGFTLSVPHNYTAYGIADLIIHVLESYFGKGEAKLSDRFGVEIIKEALEAGIPLLKELENYDYRERIMWAATNALNGLTAYGKHYGDWGVHDFGHNLSVLYDVPHGASLTIVMPAWLKIVKTKDPERIAGLGKALFGLEDNVDATIQQVENMFKRLDCPIRLQEVGIKESELQTIANQFIKNQSTGMNYVFTDEDRKRLVDFMFDQAV